MTFRSYFLMFSLFGLICSLFPNFAFSQPFWGAELSSKWNSNTVYVTLRDTYSPATRSGLQTGDLILDFAGANALGEKLDQLKPRESLEVKVIRKEQVLDLTLTGEYPVLADVWFTNQIMIFIAILMLVFLVFGRFTRVPRSIQRRALLPIVVVLLLLGIRTSVVVAETYRTSHFSLYWGRVPKSDTYSFGQDYVTVAILFGLAVLLAIKFGVLMQARNHPYLSTSDER